MTQVLVWSVLTLCAKSECAVYSQSKCWTVGYYYNRIAAGFHWQSAQPYKFVKERRWYLENCQYRRFGDSYEKCEENKDHVVINGAS